MPKSCYCAYFGERFPFNIDAFLFHRCQVRDMKMMINRRIIRCTTVFYGFNNNNSSIVLPRGPQNIGSVASDFNLMKTSEHLPRNVVFFEFSALKYQKPSLLRFIILDRNKPQFRSTPTTAMFTKICFLKAIRCSLSLNTFFNNSVFCRVRRLLRRIL